MNKSLLLILSLLLLTASAQECTRHIKVRSMGYADGDDFRLWEDGVEVEVPHNQFDNEWQPRGIVVATYLHGTRTDMQVFDVLVSQANSNALGNFIYSQPPGTRFALGCADECTGQMNAFAWDALQSIGLNNDIRNNLGWRGAFSLIGWQNADPSEVQQSYSNEPDAVTENEDCVFENMDQFCFDYMGYLAADTSSVDNICDWETVNDAVLYNFQLDYVNGFTFDDNCLSHTLEFEGTDIPEGTNDWEFQFDGTTITFTIPHLDLEGTTCIYDDSDPEEYTWVCDMTLRIWYQGYEQYQYDFQMKTSLSRVYTNELTVTVEKNEVVGDCCENVLNVETDLKWCTDITCTAYWPDIIEVERKGDMFAEHMIVSPEFQFYFLHGVSLKLGPFVPHILTRNGNNAGRLIYHFQSNVAMDGMVLEAISRVDMNAQAPLRRMMQEEEVGDDYKVKGVSSEIKIIEKIEKKDEEIHEEMSEKTKLVAAITGLAVFLVILYVAMGVFYVKNKNALPKAEENQEAQKYEKQRSNSIDSDVAVNV